MHEGFKLWLEATYRPNVVSTRLSVVRRIEQFYGDLEAQFARDGLEGLIGRMAYSKDDTRNRRPNPTTIDIAGDLRTGLANCRASLGLYRDFLSQNDSDEIYPTFDTDEAQASDIEPEARRVSLERDMQSALRDDIRQLGSDLVISDGGSERIVASGRIDILARDGGGGHVVIELKAGRAGRDAVAQIQSYMGDIAADEPTKPIRGILVASEFDPRAVSAARVVPTLKLKRYSVRFSFSDP